MISLVTEAEKLFTPKRDYIFEACTTVGGRYFVIRDEVFDIQEQKSLGNVWGSLDVFKNIFQNTILEDDGYSQVREGILSLPILESQQNLYGLRDILLEFNFFQDTWLGREAQKAGQSITDFAVTSFDGLKNFGISISQGDWTEIVTLLAKGIRYVVRKLKDALYSNIGMIADAILLAATGGTGKVVQWLPWALVTALDIYQISSNDWPEEESSYPLWMKYLTLGFDILGLVATSGIAVHCKTMFTPLLKATKLSVKAVSEYLAKNPKLIQLIETIINSVQKVPPLLKKAQSYLMNIFPSGSKFIGDVMSSVSSFLGAMVQTLKSLTGGATKFGSTVRSGIVTGGTVYGVDRFQQNNSQKQMNDLEWAIKNSKIKPTFEIDDFGAVQLNKN